MAGYDWIGLQYDLIWLNWPQILKNIWLNWSPVLLGKTEMVFNMTWFVSNITKLVSNGTEFVSNMNGCDWLFVQYDKISLTVHSSMTNLVPNTIVYDWISLQYSWIYLNMSSSHPIWSSSILLISKPVWGLLVLRCIKLFSLSLLITQKGIFFLRVVGEAPELPAALSVLWRASK